jgi:hypothetical protein
MLSCFVFTQKANPNKHTNMERMILAQSSLAFELVMKQVPFGTYLWKELGFSIAT